MNDYVHGYSDRESERLADQADTLAALLHHDTGYPAGSRVLEAGCGVGAQTLILAAHSPAADITSVDISANSLAEAERRVRAAGHRHVVFRQADIFDLPFESDSFDHVFLCFVLEHLGDPDRALAAVRTVLKPGGTLTVIEGDHGSAYFHPDSVHARRAIDCLVELQAEAGGDAKIGRRLFPLVRAAGFREVHVSPRQVYCDASRPQWVDGFTLKTFTAMVEGVRDRTLAAGLMTEPGWERAVADLRRTAGPDGVFSYTFFKAVAVK